MRDDVIQVGGRDVGFTDYATSSSERDVAVLWCHGGPGSRREPEGLAPDLVGAGYRVIGIDRPGYGASTPMPGRSIADWVPDGIAVADHLGIDRFVAVGVSTGGAYSLALAALHPERVSGVVACCALTDMGDAACRQVMTETGNMDVWSAPDRDTAIALVTEQFGADGSKMLELATSEDDGPGLPPADMALFADAEYLMGFAASTQLMFTFGVQGYADDRIADGVGWTSFDVGAVQCPVIVLHGESDTICPVPNAHHTASVVPGAHLRLHPELGHFSIVTKVGEALASL